MLFIVQERLIVYIFDNHQSEWLDTEHCDRMKKTVIGHNFCQINTFYCQ